MTGEHRIGKYLAERALGAGSFATVWLAHDEVLEVQVAVKVLADNWARNADVRRRFIDEARLLRRIDHERVVRVHDVGELADGRPYFVMALADRGTLHERIERRGGVPMDVRPAVLLGIEICDALAVVHDFGVVHRDIKPSNILLRSIRNHERSAAERAGRSVGDDSVMIADFGLAKDLAVASGFTLAGGTPAYMAPEQATATGVIDHRADLFAVTAIIYELLAGRPAFQSDTLSGVRRTRTAEAVTPLTTVRADLPAELLALIDRGLAADPDDRFDSASELRNALTDVLDRLPTTTAPRRPSARGAPVSSVAPEPDAPVARAATPRPPAPSFDGLPVTGAAGRVNDLIAGNGVFAPDDPIVAAALARLERPFTTVVVGRPTPARAEVATVLTPRRDMRVLTVGAADHPAVTTADVVVLLLDPDADPSAAIAALRSTLRTVITGPYVVGGLVDAANPTDGLALVDQVRQRSADAALLPGLALVGESSLRRWRGFVEAIAETRGVAFRAVSGLRLLRQALDEASAGTGRAELQDRMQLLVQELPLLSELDALREITAGRTGLPRGLRGQVSNLLLHVSAAERLEVSADADAATLREAVAALGSQWRVLENTGRIPFAARRTMLVAQQTLDRLHAELAR